MPSKSKKEALRKILHTAHVLDKFEKSIDRLRKNKEISASDYSKIRKIMQIKHKHLKAEMENI
jgi:hypothetical protein